MIDFSNNPVLNRMFANNSRIAPTQSNNTIVEHKNFSMAHPQRLDQGDLVELLNLFDLDNPTQQSNGMMKGNSKSGGNFHLTAGVIKFTGSASTPPDNSTPKYPSPKQPDSPSPEQPSYPTNNTPIVPEIAPEQEPLVDTSDDFVAS